MECKKKGNWEVGNWKAMMTAQWGEGYRGREDRDIVHFVVTSVKPFSTHLLCFSLCLEPSVAVITASNTDVIITSVSNWTIDNGNFYYPEILLRTIIFVGKLDLYFFASHLRITEIVIR